MDLDIMTAIKATKRFLLSVGQEFIGTESRDALLKMNP